MGGRHPDAHAIDEQPDSHDPCAHRRAQAQTEAGDADDLEAEAHPGDPARADALGDLRRRPADDEAPARKRQEQPASVERAVAENPLEEERQHEEQPELAKGDHRDRDVASRKAPDTEEAQVDQHHCPLRRAPALDQDERHQRQRSDAEGDRHRRQPPCRPGPRPHGEARHLVEPPVLLTLDEPEDKRGEPDHHQEVAPPVDALSDMGVLCLWDNEEHAHQDDDADRDVDQEGPSPGVVGGEPATEQRTDRRHPTDGGAPDGERDGSILALIDGVDRREGCREDHGPADALQEAAEDQDSS